MIVPMFMTPSGRILCLNELIEIHDKQVCYMVEGELHWDADDSGITLEYPARVYKTFTGDDAKVVRGETVFAFDLYRSQVAAVQQAQSQAASGLIVPTNGKVN